MRYVGQEHAVSVELPTELFAAEDRDGIKRRFDAVHETRYGYASPGEPAEIVSLRCAVGRFHEEATLERPSRQAGRSRRLKPSAAIVSSISPMHGFVETPTYDRAELVASSKISGPALVEEYASTTVVHPGDALDVDGFGNLIIAIGRS